MAAAAAIDGLALEQHLAPMRKGARVIREISWRWREIGADGRICDLLDSQVSAIEASCGEISSADPHAALGAAFDLIGKSIAAFDESDEAPAEDAQAEDTVEPAAAASPAPSSEMPAADIEPAQPLPDAAEAAADTPALSAETVPVEEPVATAQAIAETHAEATEQVAEAASVTAQATDAAASPAAELATEAADISAEDADAHDEAVLDMIAAEMAAYDPSDEDGEADIDSYETQLADSPAAELETVASTAEETSWETSEQAPEETLVAPEIAPAIEPPAAPPPQPALEPEPTFARLDPDRQWTIAKARDRGLRSAGRDPAPQPDREDRAVFVNVSGISIAEALRPPHGNTVASLRGGERPDSRSNPGQAEQDAS